MVRNPRSGAVGYADGYVAGSDVSIDNPGGDGAESLFEWIHNLAGWRERQGMAGGEDNRDSELLREWFDATGAVVMGRMMYDTSQEFWGVKEGGTTFTFVTDGVHSALDQAKAAAGAKNVDIAGGASTVQQYLREGLIEESRLHVVPALLGEGLRLFEGVGTGQRRVEQVRVVETPLATPLKYRFVR
ncbi:dihydrofolate reductase family protein [Streptomyces sp. NPDC050743]|uniref:dihydrofolate reductase family protein n=1 Tax=Streptomyces sp. NPDC050743 TaxID=3365634 RepID=UPI0037944AE4